MNPRRQIYGIDFSGAIDAPKRIWITSGSTAGRALRIDDCKSARELLALEEHKNLSFAALGDYIKGKPGAIFGIDFPFGLPKELVIQKKWREFVAAFAGLYESPELFRETCLKAAAHRELKRQTDRLAHTPFSPYNIRIYKQTYFGISKLLGPLVNQNLACVLPMQKPLANKPWLIEICPAATLKKMHLYISYKSRSEKHRKARRLILKKMVESRVIRLKKSKIAAIIAEDKGGDALDSVIAAMAAFLAARKGLIPQEVNRDTHAVEGWVYT
ncbi:MAG: DUF429 domain-containing protein [Deltaproteobacteria bacterium]|nr:MAG: DUF429 domain-containing protein [Deltaproteobacteria bacterium]